MKTLSRRLPIKMCVGVKHHRTVNGIRLVAVRYRTAYGIMLMHSLSYRM